MKKNFLILSILLLCFLGNIQSQELVYAEMEFPLSFLSYLRDYRFNPLDKFQTEVEGRIIELTCDPLVDIYEITSGQQAYRPCLANWRSLNIGNRKTLNFNLNDVPWANATRKPTCEDIIFSLDYRKLNRSSWQVASPLTLVAKSPSSMDTYYADALQTEPLPGEFYFPLVNKMSFRNANSPSEAIPDKAQFRYMGWGRYYINRVEENKYILMTRRPEHPYYQNLKLPSNCKPLQSIRMQAFPKALLTRNEQFIAGRVHLLSSVTPAERGYILNSAPKTQVSTYSDDSSTGFMFNCQNPYLKLPVVRRALNYAFRKKLALQKLLGGEGELISGPIPKRNFFYNLMIPPYSDDAKKALALLSLYREWGLDVFERGNKVFIGTDCLVPENEFLENDWIQSIERTKIESIHDIAQALSDLKQNVFRVQIARKDRIFVKRLQRGIQLNLGQLQSLKISSDQIQGFPKLTLIANNPEGKNPLIKEICGALKEDFEKIGIFIVIDYLDNEKYYPRLQNGKFDLVLRTTKITGTPSLMRMFYKNPKETSVSNSNYGNYYNSQINTMAIETRDATNIEKVRNIWKKAHEVLHNDPPAIYLWSRNHIILYDPRLQVITPNPEYNIPYGYTKINGLINIFNEAHLWAWKE